MGHADAERGEKREGLGEGNHGRAKSNVACQILSQCPIDCHPIKKFLASVAAQVEKYDARG